MNTGDDHNYLFHMVSDDQVPSYFNVIWIAHAWRGQLATRLLSGVPSAAPAPKYAAQNLGDLRPPECRQTPFFLTKR